jgi:hypothetical protein
VRGIFGIGAVALVVAVLAGCGGDVAGGPPLVTGQVLGDAVAIALKQDLEAQGVFGTVVGDRGGRCTGAGARWDCTVDLLISERIQDRRTYAVRVRENGCWIARQTGTDVGVTGAPHRPGESGLLRGCVK